MREKQAAIVDMPTHLWKSNSKHVHPTCRSMVISSFTHGSKHFLRDILYKSFKKSWGILKLILKKVMTFKTIVETPACPLIIHFSFLPQYPNPIYQPSLQFSAAK